jgi:surfeit locus 1 family protein
LVRFGLFASLSAIDDLEYTRVQVHGRFQHDKGMSTTHSRRACLLVLTPAPEVLVGPRTLSRAAFDGAASESGFHVVTPFVLAETAQTVLVNRGWVPVDKKNPASRPAGQVQGEQTVQAIVRKSSPKQGTFTPDNNPATNQWHWVDVQVSSGMHAMVDGSVL